MALQAQQPAVKVTLLGVQLHTERINGLFALLFLLFFKQLQALHYPDGKPHQGNNPHAAVASQRFASGLSHCSSYSVHVGPFHQIHTSRKIHASISKQKNPRQYQQPESGDFKPGHRRSQADLSPLSSRGVGNLNTKTPVLFYCSAVNFCSSCVSNDGSQSDTII